MSREHARARGGGVLTASSFVFLCRYEEEVDIGITEFLEVLGGCRELGLTGVWFGWGSRTERVTAWRHVGICGNRIDTREIDRSNFIDRMLKEEEEEAARASEEARQTRGEREGRAPDPHSLPRSVDDALTTPLGFRAGSAETLTIQLDRLTKYARHLEELGFDPSTVPGLMEPWARSEPVGPTWAYWGASRVRIR